MAALWPGSNQALWGLPRATREVGARCVIVGRVAARCDFGATGGRRGRVEPAERRTVKVATRTWRE